MKKIKVALSEDIPIGQKKLCEVDGRMVLVVHTEGDHWHAIDEMCPHRGGPLSEGKLEGTVLTCPWHQAQFEVTTGKVLCGPAKADLRRYELAIEEGVVYLLRP